MNCFIDILFDICKMVNFFFFLRLAECTDRKEVSLLQQTGNDEHVLTLVC